MGDFVEVDIGLLWLCEVFVVVEVVCWIEVVDVLCCVCVEYVVLFMGGDWVCWLVWVF